MQYAIETRSLTRTFGDKVAVENLDLRVPVGALYGFLGLNGAGKSTTIRMLTTLLEPTSGTARVAGHDVLEDPLAVRGAVGLLGDQDGAVAAPSWTAREYLGYFARLWKLPQPKGAVNDALDLVRLPDEARSRALGGYSTGMRRRVEVARALLGEPRVLFLDEPSRGLDLPAKRDMWSLLSELARESGVTIFLSSHDVPEIQALCRDLSVMATGRITYSGPTAALGEDPATFEDNLVRLLNDDATPAASASSSPTAPRVIRKR